MIFLCKENYSPTKEMSFTKIFNIDFIKKMFGPHIILDMLSCTIKLPEISYLIMFNTFRDFQIVSIIIISDIYKIIINISICPSIYTFFLNFWINLRSKSVVILWILRISIEWFKEAILLRNFLRTFLRILILLENLSFLTIFFILVNRLLLWFLIRFL